MRISTAIMISSLLYFTNLCFAQSDYKNVIELNTNFGLSNTIGSFDAFSIIVSPSDNIYIKVLLKEKYSSRVRNFNISYTRFIDDANGIKISLGRVDYGFNFERESENTSRVIRENFTVKFVEFGLSYARRIRLSSYANLLLESGLLFHINPEYNSRSFRIMGRNAFSFSNFTGFEFPLVENNFFINTGLLLKLPIMRYDDTYDSELGYYPYFIGVKLGLNYQF